MNVSLSELAEGSLDWLDEGQRLGLEVNRRAMFLWSPDNRKKHTWLMAANLVTMKLGDLRSYLLLNLGPARSRSDLFRFVRSEWECKRVWVLEERSRDQEMSDLIPAAAQMMKKVKGATTTARLNLNVGHKETNPGAPGVKAANFAKWLGASNLMRLLPARGRSEGPFLQSLSLAA